MNIIKDPWLWVVRKDGTRRKISPLQINTQYKTNPVLRVDFPRADFSAMGTQLIISLFQTFFAPDGDKEWKRLLKNPVNSKKMLEVFDTSVFDVNGDNYRFMQDMNSDELVKKKGVNNLLLESPGEKTVKDQRDFFYSGDSIKTLCPSCAIVALYTRQTNSFPGGKGYKTAIRIRQNTPVNTIIVGETLWETIVFNILNVSELNALGGVPDGPVFPWAYKTVDSSGKKEERKTISLNEMSPCYPLWEMPCRYHLIFEYTSDCCDICGNHDIQMIKSVKTVGNGNVCVDTHHFFTPYIEDKKGKKYTSLYSKDSKLSYLSLKSYLIENKEENKYTAPVISSFLKRGIQGGKLWAFGYIMEKSKYYGWTENMWTIPDVTKKSGSINQIVSLAGKVGFKLETSVRQMLQTVSDSRSNKKRMFCVQEDFYKDTEQAFYSALKNPDLYLWLYILVMKAFEVFDKYVGRQKMGLQLYKKKMFVEKINTDIAKEFKLPFLDPDQLIKKPSFKKSFETPSYFNKNIRSKIMSWYSRQERCSETHSLYSRCMALHEVTGLEHFQLFIDPFMVDFKLNGISDFTIKDRMAIALMILSRINPSKVDLSEPFPAQLAKINARHAKVLFNITDPLKDWRVFENIINILPSVNILSFVEGFVNWDKSIKKYWQRIHQTVK